MSEEKDLTKVSIITLLGLSILIFSLFWLKGYKLYNQQKIKVSFEDVSGLEEGAIVRWSGLRVGVVEDIEPVLKKTSSIKEEKSTSKNDLLKKGDEELKQIEELETKRSSLLSEKEPDQNKIKELESKLQHLKDALEVHMQQGLALEDQKQKASKNHVEVTIAITEKDIPFGPLSIISIVPTGFIGEQYVEISPFINRSNTQVDYKPLFITREPIRFERFLKANIESSEAFRDAITKINRLLQDDDIKLLIATVEDVRTVVQNVNKLVDNAGVLIGTTSEKLDQLATSSNQLSNSVVQVGENLNKILGDEEIRSDIKSTSRSLNTITTEVAKLFDEKGLAKDVLEISRAAKDTSTELNSFVKEIRQTQKELDFPKTVSNLNSLTERLDKLSSEANEIIGDKTFQEDIKVTAKKARETSSNLEKLSKKFKGRFTLFKLLF